MGPGTGQPTRRRVSMTWAGPSAGESAHSGGELIQRPGRGIRLGSRFAIHAQRTYTSMQTPFYSEVAVPAAPMTPHRLPVLIPAVTRLTPEDGGAATPLGALAHVLPGSGMVGTPMGDGARWVVDYEGNRNRSDNIITFADRVLHAAGRHPGQSSPNGYPTIARAVVLADAVVMIGEWDPVAGEVVLLDGGEAALARWLGTPTVAPTELLAGGAVYEERRVLAAMRADPDPMVQARAREYERMQRRRGGMRP